jgi:hypothetical protein
VAAERVPMRKTHEVLRPHFDLKLKQRQIARSANLSQSTVHEYLHRSTAAGLSWPLPKPELEAALFPTDPKPARAPARDLPDFSHIHKELTQIRYETMPALRQELRLSACRPKIQEVYLPESVIHRDRGVACAQRLATRPSLERNREHLIRPLCSIRCNPHQQYILNCGEQVRFLRNDQKPRTTVCAEKLRVCTRHRLAVMRNQDAAFTGRNSEDFQVGKAAKSSSCRSSEVNTRFPS